MTITGTGGVIKIVIIKAQIVLLDSQHNHLLMTDQKSLSNLILVPALIRLHPCPVALIPSTISSPFLQYSHRKGHEDRQLLLASSILFLFNRSVPLG